MCLCVFITIKNLQNVKLSLSVKTFKGNGDIVSFLYCDAPWTHLEVWVAFWPTRAQDDTRWVIPHIMCRTLHYRQKRRDVNCFCLTLTIWNINLEHPKCCTVKHIPWHVGGGASIWSLSPRRHVRISLPTNENPGWHLYLMMSPEGTKSRQREGNHIVENNYIVQSSI